MNKGTSRTRRQTGFTKVELIVVIAVLSILAGMLLPAFQKANRHPPAIYCVSNLKQIALGYRLAATDGVFSPINETNAAWNYFQSVGKEIGTPKVLLCPEDKSGQKPAFDFEEGTNSFSSPQFRNNALSYLFGLDAAENLPNMILTGDRSVSTNDQILSGLLTVQSNTVVRWADGIHENSGNIALADGSAHQMTSNKLQDQLRVIRYEHPTNNFLKYSLP